MALFHGIQFETCKHTHQMDTELKSCTIANQYPKYRDKLIKSSYSWLEEKQTQDYAEKFWRVHDKIYDLKDFADKHPGGKEWILITRVNEN